MDEKQFEKPNLTATVMVNVPYRDPEKAIQSVIDNFPVAPCLPVTTRSAKWLLEGIPCLVIDHEKKRFLMAPPEEREEELLEFYDRYEREDLNYFATTPETAPFFYAMFDKLKKARPAGLKWVVFQTAGPLILGDMIKQMDGNPVIYHETLRDVMIKGLNIKARWLEKKIKEEIPGVEVIADLPETTLVNFTSAGGTGSRDEIIEAIDGSFYGLKCVTWVHCCANIDWSLLTDSVVDVINFDAYQHTDRVVLYAKEFKTFLERGGMIGWGIVPVTEDLIVQETVQSLVEKLEKGIEPVSYTHLTLPTN